MSERDLFARAQQGDEQAYEDLVRRYQRVAFRTAYLITGDVTDRLTGRGLLPDGDGGGDVRVRLSAASRHDRDGRCDVGKRCQATIPRW